MLLGIAVTLSILRTSSAVTGLIWSNSSEDFVPLSSIPSFSAAKASSLRKSRELEYHNFHKAVLKAAYYKETNLVDFIENDTKISGVCGELWTMLADYLNFTLVPINMKNKHFGDRLENGSYDGILGLLYRNESQIIPRSGIFRSRLSLVQYTMPIWRIRYRLYIKPEWKHDNVWIIHLFSIRLWYSFFLLLLILSMAGYISERDWFGLPEEKIGFDLQDHVFYTIAIASTQGCVPFELHNRSRIIYFCTSMFSWLILIAFSSHAIYLMMNKKFILPFDDLQSLIQKSKYSVVAFSGSMVHQNFQDTVSLYYQSMHDYSRVTYAPSAEDLYKKVCFSTKQKYAAFEAEDRHKAIGRSICRLIPADSSYFETWVASAIKRGFRYKRSFDIGILKLVETGLLDGLKDRWLDWKMEENKEMPFQSINMGQTYLIFGIMVSGFILSVVILGFEYAIFYRNKRIASRKNDFKLEKLKLAMKRRENRIYFTIK